MLPWRIRALSNIEHQVEEDREWTNAMYMYSRGELKSVNGE